MNKKGNNINCKEEIRIKKVSNSNKNENKLLLIVLIVLFFLTLFISIRYIIKYQNIKKLNENAEIIEIKNKETNASIINNGSIIKKVNSNTFDDKNEIIIENINVIEIIPNKGSTNSGIKFDVKYNITKNDFIESKMPTNNSEVLVRFSYSFDKEKWTNINNVITTTNSNISPLIGNTYDIAGLLTNLNVATDYEINTTEKKEIMYWRSETIFKNLNNNDIEKEFNANFSIEYKSSL